MYTCMLKQNKPPENGISWCDIYLQLFCQLKIDSVTEWRISSFTYQR